MKKVLMVSCEGLGRGGVQAVMMDIVRNLRSEYAFDMLLFTSQVRYYDEEFLSYGGKILRVPFYEGGNRILRKLDYYIRSERLYRGIYKAIRDNGPYDVIHCNNAYESALCLKAAKKLGIPVRIGHMHICDMSSRLRNLFDTRYLKQIRTDATALLACSEESGKAMFRGSPFVAVPNAYNDSRFDPAKYPKMEKKDLFLTQIGYFDSNKNQEFTLQVLKCLRQKGAAARLALVGFGDGVHRLQTLAKELELEGAVEFLVADTDTPELLSRSAAFLLPSKKEGFGIVLVEAQAMGVACYASTNVPPDANAGGCRYLSLADGPECWADAILQDYEKDSGATKQYDCTRYSATFIMEQYKKLYRGEKL